MKSLLRRLYHDQDGQALYLVAGSLIAILGMAALSIDIGYALHAQRELQANTDAAASAGGAAMFQPATQSVDAVVNKYSGSTAVGAVYNIHPDLNITSVSVSFSCLTLGTYNPYSLNPCATSGNSKSPSFPDCAVTTSNPYGGCNVIKVVETATIPTFFAKVFGFNSLTLTATSIASGSGGISVPYHIMVVLDTTASMGMGSDTGCVTGSGKPYNPEQCAQFGVQTLLSGLAPCATNLTSCSGATPFDQVGIMAFPGICSDTASGVTTGNCPAATTLTNTTANATYAPDDYACPATNPPIAGYNNNPEYLILGFQNNYRTSDSAGLNWSSDLVKVVGAGTDNCGMPDPGGKATFYAGAIVAAQQYLTQYHTAYIQDIMILLSDGDAQATNSGGSVDTNDLGGTVPQTVSSAQIAGMNGNLWAGTNDCTQAINAADWAKQYVQPDGKSTEIYSISYGSETSGCSPGEGLTPCQTMQGIASLPLSQYFFSVPQTIGGTTSTVCANAVPITQLNQVFTTIISDLSPSRLVPNSLTGTWTTPSS